MRISHCSESCAILTLWAWTTKSAVDNLLCVSRRPRFHRSDCSLTAYPSENSGSLIIAGHYIIPEVLLFFDNSCFRGNRAVKVSSEDFHAFQSFNLPALATVGIDVGKLVVWS